MVTINKVRLKYRVINASMAKLGLGEYLHIPQNEEDVEKWAKKVASYIDRKGHQIKKLIEDKHTITTRDNADGTTTVIENPTKGRVYVTTFESKAEAIVHIAELLA